MQTVKKIQELLNSVDARALGRFGQCFLIDLNYMQKVLSTADVGPEDTIVEVGPGTGSLTEELLKQSKRVVAGEIDRKLCQLLKKHFANEPNFTLIEGDALAGKHEINPELLAAAAPQCSLVANLPYNIATSLVIEMLIESWRSLGDDSHVRFDRLTFTVQKEVAQRFCADNMSDYGIVTVITELLGNATAGAILPPKAFWPKPKIDSQIVRIDFDAEKAGRIKSIDTLQKLLHLAFTQRRKKLSSAARARGAAYTQQQIIDAMAEAKIDPETRGQELSPEDFLALTNILTEE